MLEQIERQYGRPRELTMSFPMQPAEFEMLQASMSDGRNSDVTLFIFKGDKVIVIAKPWYPEGLYRAPSGGIKPNEDMELTARREAYEETGVEIELVRYLLRIHVTFACGQAAVKWTSHIFTAAYLSGDPHPVDTKEIKNVNLLTLEELLSLKEKLLKQDSGGLHYRAALTEAAVKEISSEQQPAPES
jgi:8-oxo-dGTP pyrophosphatase MutT (NUDIX family)